MTPNEIYAEHTKCKSFLTAVNAYQTIDENHLYYNDKQWEGVEADDLTKPVFNILKRSLNMFASMIVSDDVGFELAPLSATLDYSEHTDLLKATETEIKAIIENEKIKSKDVFVITNAAIEGNQSIYFYFDPYEDIGLLPVKGAIKSTLLDAVSVEFPNPTETDAQKQDYILIPTRETVEDLKRQAKENGLESDMITADNDYSLDNDGKNADDLATAVTKLHKVNEIKDGVRQTSIKAVKVTKDAVIREEWDTEYTLYPVARFIWENVKDNYAGNACITGMIPNQCYINKIYAMMMKYIEDTAFSKLVYDGVRIDNFDPETDAIEVQGDIQNVAKYLEPGTMSNHVPNIIQSVMSDTQNTMGATDVLLGNVNPDNKGAILAIQKSSSMPLLLQILAYYQYKEDMFRVLIDMIATDYGIRPSVIETDELDETGQSVKKTVDIDFSKLKNLKLKLNVDVGASSYWSEIQQMISTDNLFSKGVLDAVQYLERIPSGYVRDKQGLLSDLKNKLQQQQAQQAQQQPSQTATPSVDVNALLKGVQQ